MKLFFYCLAILCFSVFLAKKLIEKKIIFLTEKQDIFFKHLPKYYLYVGILKSISLTAIFLYLVRFFSVENTAIYSSLFFAFSLVFISKNVILLVNPVKILELTWRIFCSLSIISIFSLSFFIIFILFSKTGDFFKIVKLSNFFSFHWDPQTNKYGFFPILYGSFAISFMAISLALPGALIISSFVTEYLSRDLARIFEIILNSLIAIPSIIYGGFASIYLSPKIKIYANKLNLKASSQNAASAGIVIGLMILPFITSFIIRSMKSLPKSLKEAALSLGSTKYETITQIIWPSIYSQIFGGTMIALARAFGETMIVTMAAGLAANISLNPLDAFTTITAHIVTLFTGDQNIDSIDSLSGFALALILIIVSFILNSLSIIFINRQNSNYASKKKS